MAAALKVLDSLLMDGGQMTITEDQAMIMLDALANSGDPSMVSRFPLVLVICARKGIALDPLVLFDRYLEQNPKRINLEKLFLISTMLFDLEQLESPKGFENAKALLKRKYNDVLKEDFVELSNGTWISINDMYATLRSHIAGPEAAKSHSARQESDQSDQLHHYMNRLFSPKQKDLVFKKLNKEAFTKTEREYYSRIVRKKLEAIADAKVREIAAMLTAK
jgi:hypothetical protein